MTGLSAFMNELESELDELAQSVNRTKGFSTKTTKQVSDYIERIAKRVCLHVEKEVYVGIQRSGKRKDGVTYVQKAHIDYQLTFFDGVKLAVEIDQTNKAWSLTKLAHCVSKDDCFGMWVRWKGYMQKTFRQNTSKICMVDITTDCPAISAVGRKWMVNNIKRQKGSK